MYTRFILSIESGQGIMRTEATVFSIGAAGCLLACSSDSSTGSNPIDAKDANPIDASTDTAIDTGSSDTGSSLAGECRGGGVLFRSHKRMFCRS